MKLLVLLVLGLKFLFSSLVYKNKVIQENTTGWKQFVLASMLNCINQVTK